MPAVHPNATVGALSAAALTVVAMFLLDSLVQQQLGATLQTVGLATQAGPGVIGLEALDAGAGARGAVDLAHGRVALAWQYGGALMIGLGTAGVLLNGVGARLAGAIEGRLLPMLGWGGVAR